jgi:hypothetical protein
MIGTKFSGFNQIKDTCSYISWASFNNLELNFKVNKEVLKECEALGYSKVYYETRALEELWQLGSYEFLTKLLDFSEQV